VKYGNKEIAQTCCKNHNRIVVHNTAEMVGVGSESEETVMICTLDGEDIEINIKERHKIL
jgi:hypothetical protein